MQVISVLLIRFIGFRMSDFMQYSVSKVDKYSVVYLCVQYMNNKTSDGHKITKNTALQKKVTVNSCVPQDWNRFLKHLSSFDLCVLADSSNSTRSVDEEQSDSVGNVSITVTASLSLVQQLSSLPHNITTAAGFLPLGGMV
jgi:hypothetical protein